MTDYDLIREEAQRRGITRLCHFTQSRKLPHILSSPDGVVSTALLSETTEDILDSTDPQRLDGYKGHVCCSVEYPNTWYLDKVRGKDPLFRDWVVLLLNPSVLWQEGTLFCPRNAATAYGRLVTPGHQGFSAMFAQQSQGAGGRTFSRRPEMLPGCPTDGQAEVLVARNVPRDRIMAVAVASQEQARIEALRLSLVGSAVPVKWIVAPGLFNGSWKPATDRGQRPIEQEFQMEATTNG